MAKELIFVADDFGMTDEINDAILYSHLAGHLNGAALMMAQPATTSALEMARAHPSLEMGWHLHLNDSRPATTDRWPWGSSPVRAGFTMGFSAKARELMRREIARQWELFRATGIECRFINSHHHLHAHPFVYRTLLDVVGPQFRGWIRLGEPRSYRSSSSSFLWPALEWCYLERRRRLSAWRSPDSLWGVGPRLNEKEVHAIVAALPDGFHEFLFHPRTRSCSDTLCLIQLRTSLAPC